MQFFFLSRQAKLIFHFHLYFFFREVDTVGSAMNELTEMTFNKSHFLFFFQEFFTKMHLPPFSCMVIYSVA
jgi:hypothetical protein